MKRFDWVSRKDLAIMVYMVEGTALNLPYMMIEQIRCTAGRFKTKAYLPYGMVFTLIFIDAEIDLEGEDFQSITHINFYTIHSLYHMGY